MQSRVFTQSNARGASVVDVVARQTFGHVISVDSDKGEICLALQPIRAHGDEIATETIRFATIHPIYGGSFSPQTFHCYGRYA